MRTALHPFRDEYITATDYIKEFGHKTVDNRQVELPQARCGFCQQNLFVRAASSPKGTGHFVHYPNGMPCLAKQMAALAYRDCLPTKPDLQHAQNLKSQFLANWQNHYRIIDKLVKNLWPSEFEHLLKEANRLRIWEYAELREYEIPYVLCTLADFPPQKSTTPNGYLRRKWFRFWFDTQADNFNSLWIDGNRPEYLWVAYYEPPTGRQRRPKNEDLISAYRNEIFTDFLNTPIDLSDKLKKFVIPILDRNLKF